MIETDANPSSPDRIEAEAVHGEEGHRVASKTVIVANAQIPSNRFCVLSRNGARITMPISPNELYRGRTNIP
jgi:hypothetical protein